MNIEEVKEQWREAPDDDVVQAATVDRNGYPPEIQAVIEQEVQRRGLVDEVEQKRITLSKANASAPRPVEGQVEKKRVSFRSIIGSVIGVMFLFYVAVQIISSVIPARPKRLSPNNLKLREIVREVMPLQEQCRELGEFKGPIVGKCLIWWLDEDCPSAANSLIPADLQASPDDPQMTVFLVFERDYTPGFGKVRTQVDICVVQWPARNPAGVVSLAAESGTAGIPPIRAKGQESYMARHVATWVKSLPTGKASGTHGKFKKHIDSFHEYSILYPLTWEPLPKEFVEMVKKQLPEGREILLAVCAPDGKLSLQIAIERVQEVGSVDELYEQSIANSPLEQECLSKQRLTVQNINAIKVVTTTTTPAGKPAKYVHLFLVRKGWAWIVGIGGEPQSFQNSESTIEAITESLQFQGQN